MSTTHGAGADLDGRLEMIGGMASMLGVKASTERILGYVEATADIPYDMLRAGIRRVIVSWRYPDMPKPADIRAAVDAERESAQRLLDAPPNAFKGVVCAQCEDNGWVFVESRPGAGPTVKRCPCYTTNPKLVAPKRFSDEPKDRHR
jgi:hypothetical protein